MGFRETWATINLDHLKHNYTTIKEQTQTSVFGVVKANAYGHGDIVIAKELIALGSEIICVSSIDEAIRLSNAGIEHDILIFSYVNRDAIIASTRSNYIYTVPSMAWYEQVSDLNLRLHVEINTGMNRYGVRHVEDVERILKQGNVEGIYTHFQSPENLEAGNVQLQKFKAIVDALNYDFKWIHVGNAPTPLIVDQAWINGSRLGLGLYGYRVDMPELKPILELYSHICYLEPIEKGETIGYDHTYTVEEDGLYGTMPIGYADNFDIRNKLVPVAIHGKFYPIVGKVCMDQTMIHVDSAVKLGDPVELIGPHRTSKMIHDATGVMTYIQLSTLSDRITRKYYRNHECVLEVNR
ncbi:alanine racemase [Erysipelothrix sp. HDW6C]|uniref:alanine racemase n=1 Tax=Erysipelothrix sp. HDW6C TaxID=2714930 RepID=UPI00140B9FB3|nr:alanine racemase [Erysipelothrix sp. HDW6C]QIK69227.1 alanine racemase [Erysipelothrix sp. HDW6C]